jgi:hypothetical protein
MHTINWLILFGYAAVAIVIVSYFTRRADDGLES